MSPSEAVVWMLVLVLFAILLWRVWRLEDRARRGESTDEWLLGCIQDRADKSGVNALSERVAGDLNAVKKLAAALGYEWKRTDAKEGWEKKAVNPFGFKPLMGEAREEAIRSIEHAINTTPNPFCSARIRYYESGDRRKADRRKPAVSPFKAVDAELAKFTKKPPKKRRAH